jgi:hypothetical protein
LALDDLFAAARQHTAAAQYAAHALPFEVFMLAMLLEEHKEVLRLREQVGTLLQTDLVNRSESKKALQSHASASGIACASSAAGTPSCVRHRAVVDPGFGLDDDPQE